MWPRCPLFGDDSSVTDGDGVELLRHFDAIVSMEMTPEAWADRESDDMFQSQHFCGGFDADEAAFLFSYFPRRSRRPSSLEKGSPASHVELASGAPLGAPGPPGRPAAVCTGVRPLRGVVARGRTSH